MNSLDEKSYIGHLANHKDLGLDNNSIEIPSIEIDNNKNIQLKIKIDSIDYDDNSIVNILLDEKLIQELEEKYDLDSSERNESFLFDLDAILNDLYIIFSSDGKVTSEIPHAVRTVEVSDYFLDSDQKHSLVPIYVTPLITKNDSLESTLKYYFLTNKSFGSEKEFIRQAVLNEDRLLLAFKEDDQVFLLGPFIGNETFSNSYELHPTPDKALFSIPLNDSNYHFIVDDNTIYLDKEEYLQLLKKDLEENGSITFGDSEASQEKIEEPFVQSAEDSVKLEIVYDIENEKQINSLEGPVTTPVDSEIITSIESLDLESQLLNNVLSKAYERNLFYSSEDIKNLHTVLKTNKFALLSGNSGIGKSQLIQLYSDSVNGNFLYIPVNSTWRSSRDLIGFYDYKSNLYRPDENNLIEFLIEAEENPDKLYFICMDNLNLAKFDSYFIPFLPIVENKTNILKLYNTRFNLANNIKSKIKINNNVKFVGLVNTDEIPYSLNNQLFNRFNIISLETLDFRLDKGWNKKELPFIELEFSTQEYNKLLKAPKQSLKLRNFLWDLYQVLKDKNVEFGPREVVEIEYYLINKPQSLSIDDAIDFQILQRILPKLNTLKEPWENLDSKIIEVFEKYNKLSNFRRSRSHLSNLVNHNKHF